jgi:hydroxymethylpyrimidine/phosphomethylpyrimidine kinase
MVPPFASALSIAGSDPTGGAGLQLDLQVFALHGVHGAAVPTALTVQSTHKVHSVLPVFPNVIGEQLQALLSDLTPSVIKLGMLATDDVLLRVALVLDRCGAPRVVDPVLEASDGTPLLERRAWANLLSRIVADAALVTPNLREAELLTGESDPERAARAFLELGAHAALIKGGHRDGPPDDFLLSDVGGVWLRGTRYDGAPEGVHGTGCALSAAIAARLARGEALESAVTHAKRFVETAITHATRVGAGQRLLGLHAARNETGIQVTSSRTT